MNSSNRAVAGLIASVAALAGLAWAGYATQPRWLARRLASESRMVNFAARTSLRQVALTFDDGPHRELTPALLDVLELHGAAATFFLLGERADGAQDLVARVLRQGHEVGNHMWNDRPSVLLSTSEFRRDLLRTHEVLAAAGGHLRFFRPGSGWFRPSMLRFLRQQGYRLILGSVAVLDLEFHDVDRWTHFVLARVQPGSVVVLHEGYPERASVVVLTHRLLDALHKHGYETVTVSQLFAGARKSLRQ